MSVKNLVCNSGLTLAIFRIPFRVLKKIGWGLYLNKLRNNSIIELGVVIEQPRQVSISDKRYLGRSTILTAEKDAEPIAGSIVPKSINDSGVFLGNSAKRKK